MESEGIERFGMLIHDAARLLRKRFEQRARDMGLSSAQWRLLVTLMRNGPSRQARLAELLEVEPISVSRLVDRMTEAGWVERAKDPDDRRAHVVMLTRKALEAKKEIKSTAGTVFDEALAGLTREERLELVASLTRVVAALSNTEETTCLLAESDEVAE